MTVEQAVGPFGSFSALLAAVRANNRDARDQLYAVFLEGFRSQLATKVESEHLDDVLHNTFGDILAAVHRGTVRDPDRFFGFVHGVIRRKYAHYVRDRVSERARAAQMGSPELTGEADNTAVPPTQEDEQLLRERRALLRAGIAELKLRDRELLTRFYLNEEEQESVCQSMGITVKQFTLIKHRAIQRLQAATERLQCAEVRRRKAIYATDKEAA